MQIFLSIKCLLWNLVKHLDCFGDNSRTHKIPEISSSVVLKHVAWLYSVTAFLITFPRNLDSQNKQGAQKGKHLRNQRYHFCLQWNPQNEGEFAYMCKWNEIDRYRHGCKHNISSIFLLSHERIQWSQNNIKWNEVNQKVVKKPRYFSSMESKRKGRWFAYW